jgi:hypothetical protein
VKYFYFYRNRLTLHIDLIVLQRKKIPGTSIVQNPTSNILPFRLFRSQFHRTSQMSGYHSFFVSMGSGVKILAQKQPFLAEGIHGLRPSLQQTGGTVSQIRICLSDTYQFLFIIQYSFCRLTRRYTVQTESTVK